MLITNGTERKLIPSTGKVLTNGTVYSDCVYLGKEADPSEWVEVDPPADNELTEADKDAIISAQAAALAELGVIVNV